MKMFIAGLIVGALGGSLLGTGLMCLLTAGSWADDEMERALKEAAGKRDRSPETDPAESRVNECGNGTM